MKKGILNTVHLALLAISFNACADIELVKGKYADLAVTLNLKTGGFAEANPWFGQAQENIGEAARQFTGGGQT
ncbi:MAG: hypothetical protein GQ583_07395 [Methyloprofundus sp.]|nr:hypothetical protein [Methyloprofundus sp.]